MFDNLLRPLKDRVLGPLVGLLSPLGPMAVTGLAFLAGLASAVLAFWGWFGAALGLWIVNRVLDGLDGAVARSTGRVSDLGGYIDILTDFIVYAALPVGVVVGLGSDGPSLLGGNPWLPLAVMLSLYYVNAASWMYLSALLEKKKAQEKETGGVLTSVVMPGGLAEGAETIVIYAILLGVPAWATILFWLMSALLVPTILARVVMAFKTFPLSRRF